MVGPTRKLCAMRWVWRNPGKPRNGRERKWDEILARDRRGFKKAWQAEEEKCKALAAKKAGKVVEQPEGVRNRTPEVVVESAPERHRQRLAELLGEQDNGAVPAVWGGSA